MFNRLGEAIAILFVNIGEWLDIEPFTVAQVATTLFCIVVLFGTPALVLFLFNGFTAFNYAITLACAIVVIFLQLAIKMIRQAWQTRKGS